MAMSVNITCDDSGCDVYEEAAASMDDGCNVIETQLDAGWVHDGGTDYCPKHAGGTAG